MYEKREGCKMLLAVRVARIIQNISMLKPYTYGVNGNRRL
jgi:hypothetical protein